MLDELADDLRVAGAFTGSLLDDADSLLNETVDGLGALFDLDAWKQLYDSSVHSTAQTLEDRIMLHMATNGGDIEEAIGSATGLRMLAADAIGGTALTEAAEGLSLSTGAELSDLERIQRGLTGTAQLAGTGAGIGKLTRGLGGTASGADDWAKVSGQLRDAAKGKGNFGIGSGTRGQADAMGKAWVGDSYRVARDGRTLISKDGLRQYRPPSYKPSLNKTQANFEQRFPGQQSNAWQSNAHLDIVD